MAPGSKNSQTNKLGRAFKIKASVGNSLKTLKSKKASVQFQDGLTKVLDRDLDTIKLKVAESRMQRSDVSCYDNFELTQMDIVVAEDKYFESVRPRKKKHDAKKAAIEDTEFVTLELKRRKSNLT